MESVATVTLTKARFFVDQAGRADPNDREAIANYLEAAIVFARSITFHLKSQFAHIPGFKEWYAEQQKRLADDRLSRFMLHQRNYVLMVGPASMKRMIGVSMTESVILSEKISVRVIRGKPWYRRSPKILLKDAIYPIQERIHRWRQRRAQIKAVQQSYRGSSSVVQDALLFTDAEWEDMPALELLKRQLATLEEIVMQAEEQFLSNGA
jgi:hypothetical protein